MAERKFTWTEARDILQAEERLLHGRRIAILRHSVGDTFIANGLIERPETEQYDLMQGNIVLLGTKVEDEDNCELGHVVAFNKYQVSEFEFDVGGDILRLDAIHVTDVHWSWPE